VAREGGVGGLDGRHQAYRDIFTASPGMSYLGPPPNLYPCNRIHHYPRGQQVAHPTTINFLLKIFPILSAFKKVILSR
jgi:hypothetical protein